MFKWAVKFSTDVHFVKERSSLVDSHCYKNVEILICEQIGCISLFTCNMGYETVHEWINNIWVFHLTSYPICIIIAKEMCVIITRRDECAVNIGYSINLCHQQLALFHEEDNEVCSLCRIFMWCVCCVLSAENKNMRMDIRILWVLWSCPNISSASTFRVPS
jgi:hypothetical protein